MARIHLDYQVENLLGNKEMPVLRQEWSLLSYLMNLVMFTGTSAVVIFAGYFFKIWFGHYREQRYRR